MNNTKPTCRKHGYNNRYNPYPTGPRHGNRVTWVNNYDIRNYQNKSDSTAYPNTQATNERPPVKSIDNTLPLRRYDISVDQCP